MQISKIDLNQASFPDSLRDLHNPPKSINVLGELPSKDDKVVAIIGTRKSTNYGRRVAYQLGSELAKAGVVVASGLAVGIDGMAHEGAVDAGGRTIAVLAHGLDRIYPAQHRSLATAILRTRGALVSEYGFKTIPLPFRFVERNRILAALCDIIVVVESAAQGGALLTVNEATNLGRQVMAVPGNITSEVSAGTNNLIRKGAAAVVSSADIITALGYIAHEAVPVPARSPDEAKLIQLLGSGASTSQDLIERSGLSAAQFANIISLMEITGKVRNLGAGQWVRR